MNRPINDAVCARLRGYLHRGMSMKEANESEEQRTTWEQWDGEDKIEAVICTEMGKTILQSQHEWVKLVYEAENVCAAGEEVVNMQKGKRVRGKQRRGRPERGKGRGGAQTCQRTQKGKGAQGVACLGVGETSTGGIMITGGTIPTTDSTMYLKKISMWSHLSHLIYYLVWGLIYV